VILGHFHSINIALPARAAAIAVGGLPLSAESQDFPNFCVPCL
jgi:hypothetical protein